MAVAKDLATARFTGSRLMQAMAGAAISRARFSPASNTRCRTHRSIR